MAHCPGTIIVAGSGRSGTTWLGNIIAGDERRILFEPFDCRRVPEFSELGLRPYFPESEQLPRWHSTIAALLSGEIANEWIDQDRNRLAHDRDMNSLVIKEIRANGMLAWLSQNFPCKVVYLIRHPCAVVASRMKLGWETHIDAYTSQLQLMEDFLLPFAAAIEAAQTTVQKHAVMWCLENLIPLRQMSRYPWIFCRYEDLVANPQAEAARILDLLELEFTPSRVRALSELSRTCSTGPNGTSIGPVPDEKCPLPECQRREIIEIVNAFKIDIYRCNR